jgi:hypothetical protein
MIKCADDTAVVGLITDNTETTYRDEVRDLAVRCQDNNLSFNISKTNELIVDYRKRKAQHTPFTSTGMSTSLRIYPGPNTPTQS